MWAFGTSLESGSLEKALKSAIALGAAAAVLGGGTGARAAGVTATVNGSKLTVTGDGTSNQVTIVQYDDYNTLYVIDEQDQQNIIVTASSGIERIEVNLGGDDDYLTYRPAHYGDFTNAKRVKVTLGSGDDYANFPFNNYSNYLITVFGSLDLSVTAGPGDDYVNGMFGNKPGGKLSFKADLGDGDDEGYADLWGDVTNDARVKFDLRGGKGDDRVQTYSTYVTGQGYGEVDVAPGSSVAMKFRGGNGNDESNNTFGGDVDGRVSVFADLGPDPDSSISSVTLAPLSGGSFSTLLNGRTGDDDLAMDLASVPLFSTTAVVVDGGNDSDTCDTTANVSEKNCEL